MIRTNNIHLVDPGWSRRRAPWLLVSEMNDDSVIAGGKNSL